MRFFGSLSVKIRDLDRKLLPTWPHPNKMYWKKKKINPQESKNKFAKGHEGIGFSLAYCKTGHGKSFTFKFTIKYSTANSKQV